MAFPQLLHVALSALLIGATLNFRATVQAQEFESFRLPNNTAPVSYDLSLRTWIDEGNLTFTGTVRIEIVALETTDSITLHQHSLSIENVRVLSEDNAPISTGDVTEDSDFDFLVIPLENSDLIEGRTYFVEIEFSGEMLFYWVGFYAQSYVNEDGDTVYFATTQFEPTDARRAFPCFDEPALKAQFTIRITHDSSLFAISNMPINSENANPDGSITTEFEETPVMSTYLVAFHISDFAHTASSASSVPQRIYATPESNHLTAHALRNGDLLLDAFSDFFEIPFALPKIDSVSLPTFGGAMENYGLVTYDDYYLVFNDTIDNHFKTISSVQTIGHELAHQWFGNLVTPTWWSYLWMKEGFATLFQHYGVDLVHTDWDMRDYMLVYDVHYVLRYESYYFYDRPMTYDVQRPEEIDYLYDFISYSKGGSVLRMFLLAFGEETFMRGVRSYLQNNMFSDVSEENLFDALALSIREDDSTLIPSTTTVPEIMASWTRQSGYPVVTVERNYNGATNQVTLRQLRYFNPTPPFDPPSTTYWIPYNYATPDNPGFNNTRLMGWIPEDENSVSIEIDSLDADDYLLLDTHAGGYYRVLYDTRNYRLITDAMVRSPEDFHVASKANLLENVDEFYRSGAITYTTVMDALRILEKEDRYVAWEPVEIILSEIDSMFTGHENYTVWMDFVRNLAEGLYDSSRVDDIPDEPILRKSARSIAIRWACNMGSVHCRSDATRALRQLIATGEEFHQNVRHQLYCAALRGGNANDFHFVWSRMLSSQDGALRSIIAQSLGCISARPLLSELLRSTLPSTNADIEYRPGEAYQIFRSIWNSGLLGMELALDFVLENALEAFEAFYEENGPYFVIDMGVTLRRSDFIERYQRLLEIYLESDLLSEDYFDLAEEIVAENREQFERLSPVINEWLVENFA